MAKEKKVVDLVRRLIFEKYRTCELLSEQQIIDDLWQVFEHDVSRMPIRQAITQLVGEGLLEVKPRQGTFVRYISSGEVREIQDARIACEVWCIERLAEKCAESSVDFSNVLAIVSEMRRLARLPGRTRAQKMRFTDLDLEFHCELVKLAGYGRTFLQFLIDLRSRFRLIAEPSGSSYTEITVKEHQRIVNAVRSGAADKAKWVLEEHLENSVQRWRARNPEDFALADVQERGVRRKNG